MNLENSSPNVGNSSPPMRKRDGVFQAISVRWIGGCSRIRTCDPLIKSQLLYQLSYTPVPKRQKAPHRGLIGLRLAPS